MTFQRCATALAAGLIALSGVAANARAPGEATTRDLAVGAEPMLGDPFPQVPIAFPKGVKAWRDVTYQAQPGFRPQIVDIYVPAGAGVHPLVLYIHGGGWMGGHTRQSGAFRNFPEVLASLAAEGFTVASVEYRLSGEAPYPAQIRDVNAALRFLRKNAAQYHLDPARVGVFGGSAGGHLAALEGLACHETSLDPAAGSDPCVQAVVTWYGVYDFTTMPRAGRVDAPERKFLGCTEGPCTEATQRAASPLTFLDRSDPPFLIIAGEDDHVVPPAQSHQAEAAFSAAGVPVRSMYFPGIDHSFVGKTADDTRKASLAAVSATFDFFHEKLGVPRK